MSANEKIGELEAKEPASGTRGDTIETPNLVPARHFFDWIQGEPLRCPAGSRKLFLVTGSPPRLDHMLPGCEP